MADKESLTCSVRVLHARGVKVCDITSSDPYVVLSVGKISKKTKTKKKTLDPIWDEIHSLPWPEGEDLSVDVYDQDRLSRDDFLGQVLIRFPEARMSSGRTRVYKLMPRPGKNDKGIIGSIALSFAFEGGYSDDPMFHKIKQMDIMKGIPCTIRICSADNLKNSDLFSNSVDSYAVLKAGQIRKKTHVEDDCKNPVWNYTCNIEWHPSIPIQVSIRDFDLLSSYDFLGMTTVKLEEAKALEGQKMMFPLKGRTSNDRGISGSVTLQFLFEGMVDPGCEDMKPKNIFGSSLEEISNASGVLVPNLVMDSVRFITSSKLERPGLFRLCGDVLEVKTMKQLYTDGNISINLADQKCSPDSIASLLKRFFFELPVPLVDFEAFDALVKAFTASRQSGGMGTFKEALKTNILGMKKSHLIPLMFMLDFLNKVASFSETNLMPISNLAVCFGPTFARTEEINVQIMTEQIDRMIVEVLLENYSTLYQSLQDADRAIVDEFIRKI